MAKQNQVAKRGGGSILPALIILAIIAYATGRLEIKDDHISLKLNKDSSDYLFYIKR